MTEIITRIYESVIILLVVANFSMRKKERMDKKRQATVVLIVILFFYYLCIALVTLKELPGWILLPLFLPFAVLIFIFREKCFPFKTHCEECGKRLSISDMFRSDDNLCANCFMKKHPTKEERQEESAKAEGDGKRHLSDIDFDVWEPTDRCVITYVEKDGNILFVEKKRGLGTGYFNAPGGHIEEDETAVEAAIRETKEETGLQIQDPEYRGTLYFDFEDGMKEIGYVFFANGAWGTLAECEETRPFWIKKDEIPYENMWEDDRLWLPGAMAGRKFHAYFLFDGKKMTESEVEWDDEE